jgi:hypothetical protein
MKPNLKLIKSDLDYLTEESKLASTFGLYPIIAFIILIFIINSTYQIIGALFFTFLGLTLVNWMYTSQIESDEKRIKVYQLLPIPRRDVWLHRIMTFKIHQIYPCLLWLILTLIMVIDRMPVNILLFLSLFMSTLLLLFSILLIRTISIEFFILKAVIYIIILSPVLGILIIYKFWEVFEKNGKIFFNNLNSFEKALPIIIFTIIWGILSYVLWLEKDDYLE